MRASSQYIRALVRGIDGMPRTQARLCRRTEVACSRKDRDDRQRQGARERRQRVSAQYALPAVGTMTADDILDAVSRVLDRVDVLLAAAPTLTDSQLLTALLTTTWGVKSVGSSFATLSH